MSLDKIKEKIRWIKRRLWLRINRIRAQYSIRKEGRFFRIVVPEVHKNKVRFFKYLFTVIGLFSSFLVFQSVFISFLFGCLIYLLSVLVERVVFAHAALFIHPLPTFDLEPDKWLGAGFGYIDVPDKKVQIPLVMMMISDLEYARKLEGLFLEWTGGKYDDEQKNISVSVVLTKPDEYIFLFYPNPSKPIAKEFFQNARKGLREESLEDEIAEQQISLVLGKRCKIGLGSYFPEFRKRYREGVPVMFEFLLPPFDRAKPCKEIPHFVLFDFSIKDKAELTKKDLALGLIGNFEYGGKWQGPTETE